MDHSESRPAGRPRDADADDRIIDAALAEYAEHGRAGYSLNGVARRAGVGKSSIYLRWPDKETLLVEAVHARSVAPDIDTGSLEGDLRALVGWLLQHFLTEAGWVAVRVSADRAEAAADEARPAAVGSQHTDTVDALWRRAAQRGEVGPGDGADIRAITRMMYGYLMLRVMRDREGVLAMSDGEREHEVEYVVGLLLRMLDRPG